MRQHQRWKVAPGAEKRPAEQHADQTGGDDAHSPLRQMGETEDHGADQYGGRPGEAATSPKIAVIWFSRKPRNTISSPIAALNNA